MIAAQHHNNNIYETKINPETWYDKQKTLSQATNREKVYQRCKMYINRLINSWAVL
jgi:hypothetical protein